MPRTRGALRRAHILIFGLLALALTTVSVPQASATVVPAPTADRYGINASDLLHADPATRQRGLATLRAGGVRVVRFDLSWSGIERDAPGADGHHTYDWAWTDSWVAELARAGLRAYPMVGYSALWAGVSPNDPMTRPRDLTQYAAFAQAGVARYGPGGSFWAEHPELPQLPVQSVELWNEENAQEFWHEQATAPRDYAQLYLLARNAIHQVAPGVEVVAGGLVARTAGQFLSAMFAAQPELRDNLDAIAYHVYLMSPEDALARVTGLRRLLDKLGATQASIELTEVGWSLLDASEAQRGENFAALSRLTAPAALRVTRIIPFAAMTAERDPSSWGDWFGLLNHDGTPKPAFVRWALEMGKLEQQRVPRVTLGARAARASGTSSRSVRSRSRSRTRSTAVRARTRAKTRAAARTRAKLGVPAPGSA